MSDLIYVIDDDKANSFLSKIMLNDAGMHNIKQFYMVEHALEDLRRVCSGNLLDEFPVIILLDLNLPVKDGWDFLNEFRVLNCDFKYFPGIFITTSSDHPRDTEKAKTYPEVIDFLPKPMTLDVAERLKREYVDTKSKV